MAWRRRDRCGASVPHSQVVVLTSYHEDEHIFPCHQGRRAIVPVERGAGRGVWRTPCVVRPGAKRYLHPSVAARVVQELYGGDSVRQATRLLQLSERELEVLRLIAQGLDNASIAELLSISEKTVKSHVSNILSKLHLADRTQAAVYAWREGVVRRDQ